MDEDFMNLKSHQSSSLISIKNLNKNFLRSGHNELVGYLLTEGCLQEHSIGYLYGWAIMRYRCDVFYCTFICCKSSVKIIHIQANTG